MFRRILLLPFCITLILYSCKTKAPQATFHCQLPTEAEILTEVCQPKMDCSFILHKNSDLKPEYYNETLISVSVKNGEQLVFVMERKYQDNPMIADDEFSEKLFFTISKEATSFYLEGTQLKDANMIFATLAYSRDGGYYNVVEGCMEGKLQPNGQWLVQGKIVITTRTKRKITKAIRSQYK